MNQYLNYRKEDENRRLISRGQYTDLIVPFDGRNDCGTKTSGDADTKSPNHTADKDIPDHVLLSPSSCFGIRNYAKCMVKAFGFSPRGNEDRNDY